MKTSIVKLVVLNSIFQFHTASSTCESNMVAKNIQNEARKFHLKDSRNNEYIVVESSTMLIRTVSSAEFEHFKQNEITWFTACNGFTPIYEDDLNHFEICIAGTENKRLFYDESFEIFMFLNQDTRYTVQQPHLPMKMRLVQNHRTNSFEYASLSCDRGHLQLENNSIKINADTETQLSIEE